MGLPPFFTEQWTSNTNVNTLITIPQWIVGNYAHFDLALDDSALTGPAAPILATAYSYPHFNTIEAIVDAAIVYGDHGGQTFFDYSEHTNEFCKRHGPSPPD